MTIFSANEISHDLQTFLIGRSVCTNLSKMEVASNFLEDLDFLEDNWDQKLSQVAEEMEDDISLTQIANEIEDDISLTPIADQIEQEYFDDAILCQIGDFRESGNMADLIPRGHEESASYVANDIFDCISFDLGFTDMPYNFPRTLLDGPPTEEAKPSVKTENCNERFLVPVSDEEIETLISAQTNANTMKNTKWAVGAFDEWRAARARNYGDSIQEIHCMSAENMNYWLQRFVMEVQKRKRGAYPPKSLYYVICGLLRRCRDMNVTDKNFLDEKDGRFIPFRRVLDARMKEILAKGVGTKIRRADPISEEDEEKLWQNGIWNDKLCLFAVHSFFTAVSYLV